MPIYEYKCEDCGKIFEKMQRMSDPAPVCESCLSERVSKLISLGSFALAGGGWYRDGYQKQA